MTEQAQYGENGLRNPEHNTNTLIGILEYVDILSRLGFHDDADRYYGLANDLGTPFIQFDAGSVLQDLLKIELTSEVDTSVQNAIRQAIEAAELACDAFYEDTLEAYNGIDFSNQHVGLLIENSYVSIQSVSVELNKTQQRKQLVANTEAGKFDVIHRSRLFVDGSRIPAALAKSVEAIVTEDKL